LAWPFWWSCSATAVPLLLIALAPLAAAVVAGLFGRKIGRTGAHMVTIAAVALSFFLSARILWAFVQGQAVPFNENLYTWMVAGDLQMHVGFLVDSLTAVMMTVVTFVSLMVHVYTIGYMHDDPGYQRFFSYISLFTFAMLMLVMANNFLQLFFGWEAVGLVSYLLIGFWFKKESAIFANLKAFLVNRVGDFGFLLGIAAIVMAFGTLDYVEVFQRAESVLGKTISILPGVQWQLITFICIALFIGAMGKSAQAPLHVWLPDSMEGPTPISALIHAATMVTAGIFMVARMSPLFELSDTALSFVMLTGAFTAFFMGLVGLVQNDIKRVIAYSTHESHRFGAGIAYAATLLGVLITALYSFRLMYLVFYGPERMDAHTRSHVKESPWVVTAPLIMLAIPSVVIGWLTIEPMLFGDFFKDAIYIKPENNVVAEIGEYQFHSPLQFVLHGLTGWPFWLMLLGLGLTSYIYLKRPQLTGQLKKTFAPIYRLLKNKYYFDEFYQKVFVKGAVRLGQALWQWLDQKLIDGVPLRIGHGRGRDRVCGSLHFLMGELVYVQ